MPLERPPLPEGFKEGDIVPLRIYRTREGETAKHRQFVCNAGSLTVGPEGRHQVSQFSLPVDAVMNPETGRSFVFSLWMIDGLGKEHYLMNFDVVRKSHFVRGEVTDSNLSN